MKSILDFQKMKIAKQKVSMITCYDFTFAKIISNSNIDAILVGDSAAQLMHGYSTTLNASIEMMEFHIAAVAKGAPNKFIVGDMPFLSTRKDLTTNMTAVERLMKAGAHAIKIEGAAGHIDLIKHIVESGVPVMGHLGLTPQSIHQLGGPKIQGRTETVAQKILQEAISLQDAGCFSLVLECVPAVLSTKITQSLQITTIGIGAGVDTDGQILVLQDMLGMNSEFKPKFLKNYLDGFEQITTSLNNYDAEVKNKIFPTIENSYE